jgi:chaperonin GroES
MALSVGTAVTTDTHRPGPIGWQGGDKSFAANELQSDVCGVARRLLPNGVKALQAADLAALIDLHPISELRKGIDAMATATKTTSKIRLQPMGERLVVQREEGESKTAGGIVLPDSAKEKPARGTVIAIGTGKLLDDGTRSKSQLKNGDRVLFTSYAGENVEIDDVEYLLMREDDILAVIE